MASGCGGTGWVLGWRWFGKQSSLCSGCDDCRDKPAPVEGTPSPNKSNDHQAVGVGAEGTRERRGWRCQSCAATFTGNPRYCPNCGYTVYDPVVVEPVQPRAVIDRDKFERALNDPEIRATIERAKGNEPVQARELRSQLEVCRTALKRIRDHGETHDEPREARAHRAISGSPKCSSFAVSPSELKWKQLAGLIAHNIGQVAVALDNLARAYTEEKKPNE